MKLPIALQLYSIRNIAENNFAEALLETKKLGYDAVEYAGFFGISPNEVKKMTEDAGLAPVSAHVPYYDMLREPEKVMSDCAAAGCCYVAVPYLTPECRPGEGFSVYSKGIVKKLHRPQQSAGLLAYKITILSL